MATAFQILAAMITPAVLISACGTLVFSTSSRVSRVVDRVRALASQIEQMAHDPGGTQSSLVTRKEELFLDQLNRLSTRAMLLRSALTGFYVAIGLFVATSITVGVVAIANLESGWFAVVLELAGSAVLLYGTLLLVREARLGVTSTLGEMEYVGGLIAEYKQRTGGKRKR